MDILELLPRLAMALGIGLLIGLERGWTTRSEAPGSRTAGIRTFALSGLLGGLAAALARQFGEVGGGLVLGLGFLAFSAVFAMFAREENRADGTFSATTTVAAMVTFALGAFALMGDERLAAAGAVAVTAILALRENLHRWVERITLAELRAVLMLLAMTFIALPVLPDRPVGPFGGVNLREIWLIAIVLAAVSFAGYVAVKLAGSTRGVLLAGAGGGLVSSTAVMLTNARRAAAGEGDARLLAAGAALATAASLARTLAIIGVLNPRLLPVAAPPLVAAILVKLAATALMARRSGNGDSGEAETTLRNPFEITAVLTFAGLIGVIVLAGRVLSETFGGAGAIAVALIAGLADTDAVVVSMTRLVPEQLTAPLAVAAILTAVASNTASKLAIGASLGGRAFAVPTVLANGAAVAVAAAVFFLVPA